MNSWVNKRYNSIIFLVVFFPLLFTGCALFKKEAPKVRETGLVRIASSDYPEFSDDMDYDGLEHGILKSMLYLNKIPADRKFRFGEDVFDAAHMIRSMEHFLNFIQTKPSIPDLRKYIRSNCLVYRSVGSSNPGQVFFTGYYEPSLEGRPEDLATINLSLFLPEFKGKKIIGRYTDQTVVPYYDRNDIDYKGVLEGKTREIAWLKDPIDLFFLQIQGSGKVNLNNHETLHVHYHTTNGRPYRSIGKLLIDTGKIPREEMSMQKIRAYLQDHPEEVETILNYNPSYVFFKIEEDGPIGYLEVKLTPGRSIALDRRLFPRAGLAFIQTQKPLINGSGKIYEWSEFSRFVLNQDTGGAINGPGRADLFWGNGTYAEIAAGHMQHHGTLYFLVLKPDAPE
ncbi:MAG: MltA domain-containing protein [Deltaproteobacteria bacterium]|nr:MltA domain-containing protein [Deltaproteobacteria bacterium]